MPIVFGLRTSRVHHGSFGPVKVGSTEIRYLEFVNRGSLPCEFLLKELTSSKSIQVEPMQVCVSRV